jgi:hypothetical protein
MREMPTNLGLFFGSTPNIQNKEYFDIECENNIQKRIYLLPFLWS